MTRFGLAGWKELLKIGSPLNGSPKKPVLRSRARICSSFLVEIVKQQHQDSDQELCRNDSI
ncbi:hypothetical protein V511_14580 [Mesotoga sp. Brook.08.YT.4.2.5.1]|nr:hypothetical protein V511_14580 [Mesotoga sp. Brook.08.YT.4.2.5.1]PNS42731.1 hypothetical protein RJ60_00425 [Mesotoga sp. B105.6.4]PVD18112.1 hypothetical protein V512_014670 [Mesotoga sp. Brook.08.105.5.1]RAO95526.1 hypothetical protein M388_06645 [Mesotoga sp. Brook.08.YT.4.2.5.4.]RDI94353.1 hypothetical protein Q502_00445 [Mesotoga sp. Brook.08.YT.4.2.5.2.]